MVAMKPRTGDGKMEVEKELRSIIVRIPVEGGGRLVLEFNDEEISQLRQAIENMQNS
ncbi:MAG: DUF3117 domain-containing protein [Actinomycetaceae bacterium]|nr:DUF3117 domain-containing protein [Actinomycetaceae bacterium]